MKESQILFRPEMIQAILEGRKTMTRRVIKPQPVWKYREGICSAGWSWKSKNIKLNHFPEIKSFAEAMVWSCPYGQVGDVLWVRETWTKIGIYLYYRADFDNGVSADEIELPDGTTEDDAKWKPSIFMPKEACRLWLRITNIRVERLQDITEEDAKKEGVKILSAHSYQGLPAPIHKLGFIQLWESINGKGSWDENPWVWVIEFERLNKE